ncbi:alpha/beta hydrolase [Kaistia dalseonensis]|uniref:Esterase/lipase superfamily enzyme n=1 Tax=Kaistia dalseonensis TaxID=410840 RepID=A0ABU0HD88_9HYPH|nr:alpha/beta hydrolase [Kaistia dalseonensis]MCX5497625.1 alpha/beta hydrolase [Kaistia dalseonensis]MDQ0440267.1 esterase/lipase superfamily enzyme [Kaistia dalseonensis]
MRDAPAEANSAAAAAKLAAETINIIYVTDRAPETKPDGSLTYSAKRSKAMSFGTVALDVKGTGHKVSEDIAIEKVTELGQFPASPYPMQVVGDGVQRTAAAVAAHERAAAGLRGEVSRMLKKVPRKEVVFFIHGYANEFDDAVEKTGSICNSLDNEFVCVALTWPAGGSGGAFMGYNVDRESGEFAVADMKKAIRIITETPGVERVHFIAHSRGADVLASALQQLGIEAYITRSSLSEKYKVNNVVLFAADIDLDVATTKMFGLGSDPDLPYGLTARPSEVLPQGFFHLTVYSSPKDRALGISRRLFGSTARLGQISLPKMALNKPFAQANSAQLAEFIDFIEFDGHAGLIGHSYFLSNPAVRDDLVALIRDRLKTGDPRRPVVEIHRPFWRVIGKPNGAQVAATPPAN